MAAQRSDARAFAVRAVGQSADPPAISFADIRLVFAGHGQDVLALDRVSFDVPPGKITTVVGPSGCGKTTLLRLASGLVAASSGEGSGQSAPVHGLYTPVRF